MHFGVYVCAVRFVYICVCIDHLYAGWHRKLFVVQILFAYNSHAVLPATAHKSNFQRNTHAQSHSLTQTCMFICCSPNQFLLNPLSEV